MGEKRYLLLQGDEDGRQVHWVDSEELDDIKGFMEENRIREFFDDVPEERDPNCWGVDKALLLEVTVKRVVAVTVVEKYEIR